MLYTANFSKIAPGMQLPIWCRARATCGGDVIAATLGRSARDAVGHYNHKKRYLIHTVTCTADINCEADQTRSRVSTVPRKTSLAPTSVIRLPKAALQVKYFGADGIKEQNHDAEVLDTTAKRVRFACHRLHTRVVNSLQPISRSCRDYQYLAISALVSR